MEKPSKQLQQVGQRCTIKSWL